MISYDDVECVAKPKNYSFCVDYFVMIWDYALFDLWIVWARFPFGVRCFLSVKYDVLFSVCVLWHNCLSFSFMHTHTNTHKIQCMEFWLYSLLLLLLLLLFFSRSHRKAFQFYAVYKPKSKWKKNIMYAYPFQGLQSLKYIHLYTYASSEKQYIHYIYIYTWRRAHDFFLHNSTHNTQHNRISSSSNGTNNQAIERKKDWERENLFTNVFQLLFMVLWKKFYSILLVKKSRIFFSSSSSYGVLFFYFFSFWFNSSSSSQSQHILCCLILFHTNSILNQIRSVCLLCFGLFM